MPVFMWKPLSHAVTSSGQFKSYKQFAPKMVKYPRLETPSIYLDQTPALKKSWGISAWGELSYVALCFPMLPYVVLCCPMLPYAALCCPRLLYISLARPAASQDSMLQAGSGFGLVHNIHACKTLSSILKNNSTFLYCAVKRLILWTTPRKRTHKNQDIR